MAKEQAGSQSADLWLKESIIWPHFALVMLWVLVLFSLYFHSKFYTATAELNFASVGLSCAAAKLELAAELDQLFCDFMGSIFREVVFPHDKDGGECSTCRYYDVGKAQVGHGFHRLGCRTCIEANKFKYRATQY